MAKTRIVNLAKELKIDVKDLIQRLKDDLGMSEHFTYLSSLDEPVWRDSISAGKSLMLLPLSSRESSIMSSS